MLAVQAEKGSAWQVMSVDEFRAAFNEEACPYVAIDEHGYTWAEAPYFYGKPANYYGAGGRDQYRVALEKSRQPVACNAASQVGATGDQA